MIVYHGSNTVVCRPDVLHSYRPLDFGKGFYVTENLTQAEQWAIRKRLIMAEGTAAVNEYLYNENYSGLNVKTFNDDLIEWIDFVCSCRDGSEIYKQYDIIIGRVANDKVFRVVDRYHSGEWDRDKALREIRVYPDYSQISFVTQKAADQVLIYKGYHEVKSYE